MYRRYEDPHVLNERLKDAEAEYAEAIANADTEDDTDIIWDYIFGLQEEIAELKERINFAWQDMEAEEMGWE